MADIRVDKGVSIRLFNQPSDLGSYLFRITDNGGATADRYTVAFSDGSYLSLSSNPSSPMGISEWGESIGPEFMAGAVDAGDEVDLALGDLPAGIVGHILARLNQGYGDLLQKIARGEGVASSRELAVVHEGSASDIGRGIYKVDEGYFVRLDGADSDDWGPYYSAVDVLRATLPQRQAIAPEYQSGIDSVNRLEPKDDVRSAIEALQDRVQESANESHRRSSVQSEVSGGYMANQDQAPIKVPSFEQFEVVDWSVKNCHGIKGELSMRAVADGVRYELDLALSKLNLDSANDDERGQCALFCTLSANGELVARIRSQNYLYHGDTPGLHLRQSIEEDDGVVMGIVRAQMYSLCPWVDLADFIGDLNAISSVPSQRC